MCFLVISRISDPTKNKLNSDKCLPQGNQDYGKIDYNENISDYMGHRKKGIFKVQPYYQGAVRKHQACRSPQSFL